MDKKDFYVYLPSNSQEGNTPSKYITTFKRAIEIDELNEWEVGLKEITYKNTIKTIDRDYAEIYQTIITDKANTTHSIILQNGDDHKINLKGSAQIRGQIDLSLNTMDREAAAEASTEPEVDPISWKTIDLLTNPIIQDPFTIQRNAKTGYIEIFNKSIHPIQLSLPENVALALGFKPVIELNRQSTTNVTLDVIPVGGKLVGFHLPLSLESEQSKNVIHPTNESFVITVTYRTLIESKLVNTLHLKSGAYVTPRELESELNKNTETKKFFTFDYNRQMNRFYINTITTDISTTLHLKNGLHDVLGFENKIITYNKEPQQGKLEVNLMRGISSFFIYCNVIEPIQVGSNLSPLLRQINYNRRPYGEMINETFNEPIYIPLSRSYIDAIDVVICDSTGEMIPFAEGLTTLLLHFKRK